MNEHLAQLDRVNDGLAFLAASLNNREASAEDRGLAVVLEALRADLAEAVNGLAELVERPTAGG